MAIRSLESVFSTISCVVHRAARTSVPAGAPRVSACAAHYRLYVAEAGAADVLLRNVAHRLEAGSIVLVPPGVPHEVLPDAAQPLTTYVIDFDARLHGVIDVAVFCGLPVSLRPGEVRRPKIAISAHNVVHHLNGRIPGYQLAIHTHCVRLLDLIWKETLAQGAGDAPAAGAPGVTGAPAFEVSRLMPAIRLIESRYAERVALAELAGSVHLQPAYFSALFKRTTGHSPVDFLNRYRLARVRDLLLASDRPLEEVAALTGFYDASHLIRVFRRVEGTSPGRFRRARRAAGPRPATGRVPA
jgi:AraC-like DNA-binding protein